MFQIQHGYGAGEAKEISGTGREIVAHLAADRADRQLIVADRRQAVAKIVTSNIRICEGHCQRTIKIKNMDDPAAGSTNAAFVRRNRHLVRAQSNDRAPEFITGRGLWIGEGGEERAIGIKEVSFASVTAEPDSIWWTERGSGWEKKDQADGNDNETTGL